MLINLDHLLEAGDTEQGLMGRILMAVVNFAPLAHCGPPFLFARSSEAAFSPVGLNL